MSNQAFKDFVPGLSAMATPTGTEVVPGVQSGASKKVTLATIAALAASINLDLTPAQIWVFLGNLGITFDATNGNVVITKPDGTSANIPVY